MATLTIHLAARTSDVERFFTGGAPRQVVKQNSGRTVWRVELGAPPLYVKRFPRELLRDRARHEAVMLRALADAGIPCPRLVATARDRDGSYVVTEEVTGGRVLKSMLAGGGHDVRALLRAFADLTRRMLEARIEHGDWHAGNVLVRDEGGLFVLDVHRARQGAVSPSRRREVIAFAAMSFLDLVSRAEVERFLRSAGVRTREERRDVEARIRSLLHRHWRSRDTRCTVESTGFGVSEGVYYRRGAELERIQRLVEGEPQTIVKRDETEMLARLAGGLFLKRTRRNRALAIWRNAHALTVRGVPTPRLHACGPGWVVGEWIDATNLGNVVKLKWPSMTRAERDALIGRLARTARRMHDRGIYHKDFKCSNVLVDDSDVWFVDLDRVAFYERLPERIWTFNLAQLSASIDPALSSTDRLRFLYRYFGCSRALWSRRREIVGRIYRLAVQREHFWPARKGRR